MPYTHTTFAQAKQRLADELGDTGKVFFTDTELGRYIIEALRWWGLESMYFRETGTLTTSAGQPFYTTELISDSGGNALQPHDITDRDIINDVLLALMEPTITNWAGGWIGTEMFNLEEIVGLVGESVDDLFAATGMISFRSNTPTVGPVIQQRLILPETIIHIVRAAIAPTGTTQWIPIWPTDQIQIQSTVTSASFPEQKRPKTYSVSYTPQLTMDFWPPPDVTYDLSIFAIEQGFTFDPVNGASILLIPNDLTVVLKYKMLHELFNGDGLARSPQMAEYADMRYRDGLESIFRYQTVLWSDIGGVRRPITSQAQLDQLRPTWQHTQGPPKKIVMSNLNRVTVFPVPNGVHAISLEMVRVAPIPLVDGDFIQVGRDVISAIYAYAYHIALIKSQGTEFEASLAKYEEAKLLARDYRDRMAAFSPLYRYTQLAPTQNRWARPYRKKGAVEADREARQAVEI